MHLLRISIVAILLTISVSASAAPKVPLAYEPLPKLTLGMSIADLNLAFSATELPGDEPGVRRFRFNANNPTSVYASRILCEFEADAQLNYHLAYAEIEFKADFVKSNPFAGFTAPYVRQLGEPASTRIHPAYMASPEESVMWRDGSAVFILGRTTSAYILVLARPTRFDVVVSALTTRNDERKSAEALARAETEQQTAKTAALAAVQTEWKSASINVVQQFFTGTAPDVRRAASRVLKAATARHGIQDMDEDDLDEVRRWASRVKSMTAEKKAVISAIAGWQETGLKLTADTDAIIRVELGERWSISPHWGDCDPLGYRPEQDMSQQYPVTGIPFPVAPSGALICDAGLNTVPASIELLLPGFAYLRIAGKGESMLRCRINDELIRNNSGSLTIYAMSILNEESSPLPKPSAEDMTPIFQDSFCRMSPNMCDDKGQPLDAKSFDECVKNPRDCGPSTKIHISDEF